MPQMQASVRARFYIDDIDGMRCGFIDDAEKEAAITELIAVIEDAEGYAENEGREEMIDVAQENGCLRLLNQELQNVARTARNYFRVLDNPEGMTAEEFDTALSNRLKYMRQALATLKSYEEATPE